MHLNIYQRSLLKDIFIYFRVLNFLDNSLEKIEDRDRKCGEVKAYFNVSFLELKVTLRFERLSDIS